MFYQDRLIAQLLTLAAYWDNMAQEARQWADQWQPGDLPPAYLYGCADQLEQNAKELRHLVKTIREGLPPPGR